MSILHYLVLNAIAKNKIIKGIKAVAGILHYLSERGGINHKKEK